MRPELPRKIWPSAQSQRYFLAEIACFLQMTFPKDRFPRAAPSEQYTRCA